MSVYGFSGPPTDDNEVGMSVWREALRHDRTSPGVREKPIFVGGPMGVGMAKNAPSFEPGMKTWWVISDPVYAIVDPASGSPKWAQVLYVLEGAYDRSVVACIRPSGLKVGDLVRVLDRTPEVVMWDERRVIGIRRLTTGNQVGLVPHEALVLLRPWPEPEVRASFAEMSQSMSALGSAMGQSFADSMQNLAEAARQVKEYEEKMRVNG